VALNPVRAGLVTSAWDWPWSSVHAHARAEDDGLVAVRPVLDRIGPIAEFLQGGKEGPAFAALRGAERTGRPVGTAAFIADLEQRLGRPIARRAPGRKPKGKTQDQLALL
jgi:putative transposase